MEYQIEEFRRETYDFSQSRNFHWPFAGIKFDGTPVFRLSQHHHFVTGLGVVVTAWSAALLCLVFRGRNGCTFIPLAFLVVVILVALRFGAVAGMLGSASAAVIFAFFLYRPVGIHVEDPAARMNLAWLVLGGLACSYLLAPEPPGSRRHE